MTFERALVQLQQNPNTFAQRHEQPQTAVTWISSGVGFAPSLHFFNLTTMTIGPPVAVDCPTDWQAGEDWEVVVVQKKGVCPTCHRSV